MTHSFFNNFTNKYPVQKTLKFELIPQGETLNNIEKKGLILQDQNRAVSYQEMKKTIDEYHKWFIELALKNVNLGHINEYIVQYFTPKEERDEKAFVMVRADLRKEITKKFEEGEAKEIFKNLFLKELIKDDLQRWISLYKPELYFNEGFKSFTTYFTGFHENRKNLYSSEEQSTAIAYRIVHENLPKFLDNIKLYEFIKNKSTSIDFEPIYQEMEDVIQGNRLDDIFNVKYCNQVLGQTGIEFINAIIGGKSLDNGKKIKGLNEYINLFNQKQNDKRNRLPKFKMLYKQILSDRGSISYLPQAFENDEQLLDTINTFYKSALISYEHDGEIINVLQSIKDLLSQISLFDTNKIYLRNDGAITNISNRLFGDYSILKLAISFYYDTVIDPYFQTKFNKPNISEKRQEDLLKEKAKWNKEYISVMTLQHCLDHYITTLDKDSEISKKYNISLIADYFRTHFTHTNSDETLSKYDLTSNILTQYKGVEGLLNIENSESKTLTQDKERVHQLKVFLDSILELMHFAKPLKIASDSIAEKDESFYSQFLPLYDQLALLTPIYNMVRNYVTQKPYSTEKIKLNFENSTLLVGWDVNKESDNSGVILRKDKLFYLAIMDKSSNKVFKNAPRQNLKSDAFEKMNYKLLPGVNKMLPKVFFGASNIEYYNPSDEILRIRNTGSHSKNGEPQGGFSKAEFNLNDCHAIIDFFKQSLQKHEDWKHFDFKFSDTTQYNDMSGFYREVEHQGYKLTFDLIPETYINEKVESGEMYLFQLYNKDFSKYSKGTPNMHTLYWRSLFEEDNLANVVYKLNGQAEMFYRKASIKNENIITHPKNEPINSKNPLKRSQNKFEYDIIKDRRYTADKFQFHVPITLNFKATGNDRINENVNAYIKNNTEANIIGLDRGERNLIYLTLINQKGEILKQESLNTIDANNHLMTTDYHLLLDNKERQRAEARVEWGEIESIKELKEGYISQVIHKIATMMVENNAIVAMEDLNFGFKRGRFRVEKQVYQKLEKMLIDKLNYLVFKQKDKKEIGGIYNALQLANKFESFQKLGKQSGFIYYVPAWNTSKIDPVTGFVDFLKPRYTSVEQSKLFFGKMKSIRFNPIKDYFEFEFDYNDFTTKAEGTKTNWVVCTYGKERFYYSASDKKSIKIDITDSIKSLLISNNILFGDGQELRNIITNQTSASFHKRLIQYLGITLALRYSSASEMRDFILSPVADKENNFYNSETAVNSLPKDADANGAYNIALKGLWALFQINETEDLKKVKLAISNKEWLHFIQNKVYSH